MTGGTHTLCKKKIKLSLRATNFIVSDGFRGFYVKTEENTKTIRAIICSPSVRVGAFRVVFHRFVTLQLYTTRAHAHARGRVIVLMP